MARRKENKEKVARISFSLQPDLLKSFDRVHKILGYDERSRALQIAIQSFINDFELKEDSSRNASGTILILYKHDTQNIDRKLTDIGHDHRMVIVSSLHQHLDEENCLNIIVVRGRVQKILELEKDVRKLNGVKQIKYAYFIVGQSQ
jgi:CopG family transcriptional regulator, nickel-responsive regulator